MNESELINEIEVENRLEELSKRHMALRGAGLSMVVNPGRWTVTSGGGSPWIFASGVSAADAFDTAAAQLTHLEQVEKMAAATLGIEAAQ